jgi:hypothetical protein
VAAKWYTGTGSADPAGGIGDLDYLDGHLFSGCLRRAFCGFLGHLQHYYSIGVAFWNLIIGVFVRIFLGIERPFQIGVWIKFDEEREDIDLLHCITPLGPLKTEDLPPFLHCLPARCAPGRRG